MLNIECADGQLLPYLGLVEVPVEFTGTGMDPAGNTIEKGLFLVVPASPYNSTVPILIGTNLLHVLMTQTKEHYGQRFLQDGRLTTPTYLSFRCIHLRERELARHHYRLAVVKSAETTPITIRPNSEVIIHGRPEKKLNCPPVCALINSTPGSSIPNDIDIIPSVVSYSYGSTERIKIRVSNVSTRTVTVQPRSLLCELQMVGIEDIDDGEDDNEDALAKIEVHVDRLSEDEESRAKALLEKYRTKFATSDIDLGHTDVIRHRIDLHDDTPFRQRHRRIPPSMLDEVRNHLHQLLAAGVIQRSHSPWTQNVVLVRKKNGQLRLCVDYRQLNQRTVKDAYALPRIDETLDSLAGNKFFSVLDLKSGYHQVEIQEIQGKDSFYCWATWILRIHQNAIWTCKRACYIPAADGRVFARASYKDLLRLH